MIACVIPTYKAKATICQVVDNVMYYVDLVIVVDDACPQYSGDIVCSKFHNCKSVKIIKHTVNRGVGGATKTGIEKALSLGAKIIIKVDADNQMDPQYIPKIVKTFQEQLDIDYIKGDRFIDPTIIRKMPIVRLLGNSFLSLMVKFSSGYWNILDPTNGYIAFNSKILKKIDWLRLSNRYFFEIHTICMLGMVKAKIVEIGMPAIYENEKSNLNIPKILIEFPPKLFKLYFKRIFFNYFLYDFNLASIFLLSGFILVLFSTIFGCYEWIQSLISQQPRTAGTIMLAALPFMLGFQLIINALTYDVQFGLKTTKLILNDTKY